MPQHYSGPYRIRTWVRSNLPWFLIDLGVAKKGKDCESRNGKHEWYNMGNDDSACYHCEVIRKGQLWKK